MKNSRFVISYSSVSASFPVQNQPGIPSYGHFLAVRAKAGGVSK